MDRRNEGLIRSGGISGSRAVGPAHGRPVGWLPTARSERVIAGWGRSSSSATGGLRPVLVARESFQIFGS
jgi:hypothetical protein